MTKRILAILLSALMAFSAMPTAFAEETKSEAEKSVVEEVSQTDEKESAVSLRTKTAAVSNDSSLVDSGKCGNNATWTLDREGKLTISGTGKLWMMNEYSERPWAKYLENYKNVTWIEIKSGITNIPNYAFYGSSSVTKVTIPNTVTSIGKSAFQRCGVTGSLYLPESITEIEEYAFYGCTYLTSITIPSKVKMIKSDTFEYSGLISVTIPKSVTTIGDCAFYNLSSLRHVYYKGTNADWKKIIVKYYNSALDNATLHCASHSHTYKTKVTAYATFSRNGTVQTQCTSCGYISKTTSVPKISTVSLTWTNTVYSGNSKHPTVIVKDSKGNKLKNGTDYTVSYSNSKSTNVGKYYALVKFKGKYSGNAYRYYYIKPKTTSLYISAYSYSNPRKIRIYWNTQKVQTAGYQIQYSTSSNFSSSKWITINNVNQNSTFVSGLKKNTRYYFRIRTYKYYSGNKIYSSWSQTRIYRQLT